MSPATYEMLTIAQRYEIGRSDGYSDGAHCAQWSPALVHDELAELRDRVRIARDGRLAALAAFFDPERWQPHYGTARAFQAYEVGFARGYREGVNDYHALDSDDKAATDEERNAGTYLLPQDNREERNR